MPDEQFFALHDHLQNQTCKFPTYMRLYDLEQYVNDREKMKGFGFSPDQVRALVWCVLRRVWLSSMHACFVVVFFCFFSCVSFFFVCVIFFCLCHFFLSFFFSGHFFFYFSYCVFLLFFIFFVLIVLYYVRL